MDASSSQKGIKGKPRLVACRECHRSKLKCDRVYPCKSCIKRGCADICPDGILAATKRQKSAIEAANLRERNAVLIERVKQLEDGLSLSHARHSNETHPLLIKEEGLPDGFLDGTYPTPTEENVIDAFGTLSIASDGRSRYHNQSAGADYFAETEAPDMPTAGARALADGGHVALPSEIMELASLFPFGPPDGVFPVCSIEDLLRYLPSADVAWSTCELYFQHGAWLYDPIGRSQFLEQVYSHVYNNASTPQQIGFDRLSLLFTVLAHGKLLDLSIPYDIRSAELYYQLARAAFCIEPALEAATIPIIQTLFLIIVYMYRTDRQVVEYRWLNMGLLSQVIFSAGLHRDSASWIRDDPEEIERRRKLFWEAFAYDTWICFIMGRPGSFHLPHIQCRLPYDPEPTITEGGQVENSFHIAWKYQFRSQCLLPLVEEAFGAKSPNYATIVKLDRKVRDFHVPQSLQLPGQGGVPAESDPGSVSLALSMQRYVLFCERETTLLYLHRSFFAQAVTDCPHNPLESKYATSVSAAYRSASLIVAGTHDCTVRHPELASRLWFLWSNLFSAAVVLGSLVTRSPACQLSASAMGELDLACELMEKRAARGRSAKAVPILQRLRGRARNALQQHSNGTFNVDKASPQSDGSTIDEEDELAMFAGRTRFISSTTKSRSPTSSPQAVNPPQSNRRESFSYGDMHPNEVFRQVHPSVVEYLRGINGYVPPPTLLRTLMEAANASDGAGEALNPSSSPTVPAAGSAGGGFGGWTPAPTDNAGPAASGGVMYPVSSAPPYGTQQPQQGAPSVLPGTGGDASFANKVFGGGVGFQDLAGSGMAPLGGSGYPGEVGDRTWQQLMIQLGIGDGVQAEGDGHM